MSLKVMKTALDPWKDFVCWSLIITMKLFLPEKGAVRTNCKGIKTVKTIDEGGFSDTKDYAGYLTAHNWQKRKSTFLACHFHEIYREEVVGLKSSNYT